MALDSGVHSKHRTIAQTVKVATWVKLSGAARAKPHSGTEGSRGFQPPEDAPGVLSRSDDCQPPGVAFAQGPFKRRYATQNFAPPPGDESPGYLR